MKGSSQVATIFGIPVKIHWSFGLLFVWLAYSSSKNGFNTTVFISLSVIFLSVFVCVILHEFGHALTARRFGVKTFDIIMTPIGGIARLEKLPEGRGEEFWVAIAGPMVNFAITGLIMLGFLITGTELWAAVPIESWTYREPVREYFYILMMANLGLGIFNLLPAFPMDGGRILRSLLSLRMERSKATRISSIAGQVIALAMLAYGWYTGQPILALIGTFIFFAARQENRMLQQQVMMNNLRATDLMEPVEHVFFTGQSIASAQALAKNLKSESFVVWSRPGIPAGYVTKERLLTNTHNGASLIDAFIIPAPLVVTPEMNAAQIFSIMLTNKIPLALVSDSHYYIGVIPWRKVAGLVR